MPRLTTAFAIECDDPSVALEEILKLPLFE